MEPISMTVGVVIFLLGVLFGRMTRPKRLLSSRCDCGHSRAFHNDNGCSKYIGMTKFNRCECILFTGPPSAEELMVMSREIIK